MRTPRAGFTLIEVVLATALLGLVLGSAFMFTVSSSRLHQDATARGEANATARRILDRIASELAFAESDSFFPDPSGASGSSDLRFNRIEDVVAGVPIPGVTIRLWRQQSPTDGDDGLDNDGNGSIDEGRLMLVIDDGGPAQRSTILVGNVRELFEGEVRGNLDDENGNGAMDESGFFVHRNGSLLTIGISIEEPTVDGRVVVASAVTTIALRN